MLRSKATGTGADGSLSQACRRGGAEGPVLGSSYGVALAASAVRSVAVAEMARSLRFRPQGQARGLADDMRKEKRMEHRITRRRWLKWALAGSAGAALAACAPKVVKETVVVEVEKEVEKVIKETVVVEGTPQVIEKVVTAPPAPREKQVIRYWLPPTTEQAYREQMINEFMQMNPDIEIKMDGADPAKYNEATQLLFAGGTPPDVFWKFNLTFQQMLEESYLLPYPDELQTYLTTSYPDLMFVNSLNMNEGHLYGFWPVGKKEATRVLYMNDDLFERAGIAEPPQTWSDFRQVAKQLTEAGGGQSYGLILGGKSPWDYTGLVGALAYTAGPMASAKEEAACYDWTKALLTIDSPYMVAALQLCVDMYKEGSLFPGFSTISHTESRAGLASGWAGMYVGGWWDAGAYNTQFADFSYSVAPPPVFDGGRQGYNLGNLFIERVYISKETKVVDAVTKFLLFKFGPAYQKGWARNGWFTTLPEANEPTNISDPKVMSIFDISEDIRMSPSPIARNPEQARVSTERKALHPNWGELLGGVFAEQLTVADYETQAGAYIKDDRAELERAITALKDRGIRVSIDDWVFPNWDPSKDYTNEMYAELPTVTY
jgi:multiple sugar transport system substrate-binding protein